MENQTRFNLNAAIENWRAELATQTNLTADDRRELETHLRDTIAGLRQRGLNDEETFWLARRRIGQPHQLGEEFVKADPAKIWRERVFWMWMAVFLSSTLGSVAHSVTFAIQLEKGGSAQITMLLVIFALAGLIPIILAALLAKGKLVAQFSKLTLLVKNRLSLAIAAFVCIALSSSIWGMAFAKHYTKIGDHQFSGSITQGLASAFYPLIITLVLLWLMPSQNRKTSKRA